MKIRWFFQVESEKQNLFYAWEKLELWEGIKLRSKTGNIENYVDFHSSRLQTLFVQYSYAVCAVVPVLIIEFQKVRACINFQSEMTFNVAVNLYYCISSVSVVSGHDQQKLDNRAQTCGDATGSTWFPSQGVPGKGIKPPKRKLSLQAM
jgi:hypothetical protein